MRDVERLLDGKAHYEHDSVNREKWRLHLSITVESRSGHEVELCYRTKLVFESKDDCQRWHADYFSVMLRMLHDGNLSSQFRAALANQIVALFEPMR
jgi:hypothetical protein